MQIRTWNVSSSCVSKKLGKSPNSLVALPHLSSKNIEIRRREKIPTGRGSKIYPDHATFGSILCCLP